MPNELELPTTNSHRPVSRVGIAVISGCLILTGAAAFAPRGEPAYDPNNASEVISHCEAAVESNLKAPATARFDSTATGNNTWTVTGSVDAENGFGAMIRSHYQCTVTVEGVDSIRTQVDYID